MREDEDKPIRVVDRRMFTPEGELRPEFQAEQPAEFETSPAAPPREQAQPSAEPPASTAEPQTDFASIVRSFATTAYSALGLLPDPAGGRHRDPLVARQMIDWLGVLESKTRGNLSFEESDFLSRALYELRLAYVEVTRPPAK
jgi:hypothetical protein